MKMLKLKRAFGPGPGRLRHSAEARPGNMDREDGEDQDKLDSWRSTNEGRDFLERCTDEGSKTQGRISSRRPSCGLVVQGRSGIRGVAKFAGVSETQNVIDSCVRFWEALPRGRSNDGRGWTVGRLDD